MGYGDRDQGHANGEPPRPEDVVRGVAEGLGRGLGELGRQMSSVGQAITNQARAAANPNEQYLMPATTSRRLYVRAILCWWIGITFALAAPGFLMGAGGLAHALVSAAIAVPLLVRARKASQEIRLAKAYRACRPVLLARPAVTVQWLAQSTGSTADKMTEQLQGFVQRGWTPQGHLSRDGKEFLLTNELYQEYEASARKDKAKQAEKATLTPEQARIMGEVDSGVRQLGTTVAKVAGEAGTRFQRTHALAAQIEDEARKHPETLSQLGMFSDYYLPTTAKLAEAYAEIQAKPHASADEQAAAQQILISLDDINGAYEKLLDSMSAARVMDIESDLAAMQSMLRQDGLAE